MPEQMRRLIGQENLFPQGSLVLCAVSGGADSVCLLAGLYRLRESLGITLLAAHYNHQLRGTESDRDEAFVRDLIRDRFPDVQLHIGRGDVAARAQQCRTGLEETARAMRYAFLRETAREAGAHLIATAHTADDNAETVLLHLARGSGLQGLSGMLPLRDGLVRPLLTTTRREVEEFLAENGILYVEDSTNSDHRFSRNRVRHQVIPVLESLYPGFALRVSENGRRLREDEAYLSGEAEKLAALAHATPQGLRIPIGALAEAPVPIAVRAVRKLLTALQGGDDGCSAVHLEQVLALCRGENPSAAVDLPKGLQARREYDCLHLLRREEEIPLVPVPVDLNGETQAGMWRILCKPVTYGGERPDARNCYLSQRSAPVLSVRTRQEGDRLKLPGRPTKTVKKWLVERKVLRSRRDGLPVLTCGEEVAAVTELGMDERFLPAPGEPAWYIRMIPREEVEER